MELPERGTRMVPETEEGPNSIAYIIKEELQVEEDDDDWSFYQQVAKHDDTIGKRKNENDSFDENVSDIRITSHVNYDHDYTLWAEGSFSSQSSITSDNKHIKVYGSNLRESAESDTSSIPELPETGIKDGSYSKSKDNSWNDKKLAGSKNIPISIDDIINLSAEEFNERIIQCDIKEPHLSHIREIRRRGKNRVAAQNCRKRKLDQILTLAEEVKLTRERKIRLIKERNLLMAEKARMKDRLTKLYRHVYQSVRDQEGNNQPYTLITNTV